MKDTLVGRKAGTGPEKGGGGRCPCDHNPGAADWSGQPHPHAHEQVGPEDRGRAAVTGAGAGVPGLALSPARCVSLCVSLLAVTPLLQMPEAKQAFLRSWQSPGRPRGQEGLVRQTWPLWSWHRSWDLADCDAGEHLTLTSEGNPVERCLI